jgi:hypothetical protein
MAGSLFGSRIGPPLDCAQNSANSGAATYAMAADKTGWCARFIATGTGDIKSVKLRWVTVSAPGAFSIRIETIDATTGLPTGTLYDANAALTGQVPSAGVQTYTFAALPTTGLTVGTMYALVVLTTTVGTTQTLASTNSATYGARYPVAVLTAADGTTRTNFAEVAGNIPTCSFVLEDDSENNCGCSPYLSSTVSNNLVTTAAVGMKVVLNNSANLAGIQIANLSKTGTPAGDLRCQIFNDSNALVTGTNITIDKDYLLTSASTKAVFFRFASAITLAAGTYRVAFDAASDANSSNCWNIKSVPFTGDVATGFRLVTWADIAAPQTYTDSSTDQIPIYLIMDADVAPSGTVTTVNFIG